jgi:putative membrane protein insertion efficiency factor
MSRLLAEITRLPQRVLVALVQGYRLLLKPWLGNACRFEPTCSAYALQALERHGAMVGAALSAGRVLRCNPWCNGGCDPVPAQAPRLFTRLGLGERHPTLDKKKLT